MKQRRISSVVIAIFVAFVTSFYVAQFACSDSHLFRDVLTEERLAPFVSLAKLAPQLLGAIYAAGCARHYEKGNVVRRAWTLMSVWLGSWFLGQIVLGIYVIVLKAHTPIPSLADLFFFVGFVAALAALTLFIRAYRASGFAVGSARDHAPVIAGTVAISGIVAYRVLLPIAHSGLPLLENVVNLSYPAEDLLMFCAVAILLRIALGFRGGQVWRVWGAILTGILCATGGDMLFAYSSVHEMIDVGPFADLGFTLGYALCAYGVRVQYELVTDI